jgi:hypothetical protein
MKMTAVWDTAPSCLEVNRRFRGAYCRHNQSPLKRQSTSKTLSDAIFQKAIMISFTLSAQNNTSRVVLFSVTSSNSFELKWIRKESSIWTPVRSIGLLKRKCMLSF